MKKLLSFLFLAVICLSCKKNEKQETLQPVVTCNIQQILAANALKVTIINGIWGTVSSYEGNCMPVIGPNSTCKHCPAQRTVKIYAYTTAANAVASSGLNGFYDSFNTTLIKQTDTDSDGFFQMDLPTGNYTMVIVENGKLFGNRSTDGQGGINPFTYTNGQQKVDFSMTYKAVF